MLLFSMVGHVGSSDAFLPTMITAHYYYIDIHQLGTQTNPIMSIFVFKIEGGGVSFVWFG